MGHMLSKQTGRVLLLSVVIVATVASPAAAAISLEVQADYGGTNADTQTVDATMTLSPSGSQMNDVEVDISETDDGFVDFDSFEVTTSPGTAEVNVTYVGDGQFTIPELATGQQVTITFDAYPRTIKQQSLDVARVDVTYVQNGQNLQESQPVTADLSSSAWFAFQNSQDWRLYTMIAAALFVVTALVAGYLFVSQRGDGGNGGGGRGRSTRGR